MVPPPVPGSARSPVASPQAQEPANEPWPDAPDLHGLPGDGIRPGPVRRGARVVPARDLSAPQREAARSHFVQAVFPALTPLAVDPAHPFPRLRQGALAIAVSLQRRDDRRGRRVVRLLAIVQIPAALSRLVPLPCDGGGEYVLLEDLVVVHAGALFPGHDVREAAAFRVVRDGERGAPVRIELAAGASRHLEDALAAVLGLHPALVRRVAAPVQRSDRAEVAPGDR